MASVKQVLQLLAVTYSSCIQRNPLLTNSITGFIISATGDAICQRYEHSIIIKDRTTTTSSSSSSINAPLSQHLRDSNGSTKDSKSADVDLATAPPLFKLNLKRTLDMGLIRALAITPFVVNWYPLLYVFSPGKKIQHVLGRIIIDQSIGSPIVIGLVFLSNSFLNFANLSNGFQRILEHGFVTWTKGLCYWPLVHMFTFGIIPKVHQPLFGHVMSLYWNFILSFYANKKKD